MAEMLSAAMRAAASCAACAPPESRLTKPICSRPAATRSGASKSRMRANLAHAKRATSVEARTITTLAASSAILSEHMLRTTAASAPST